MFTLHRDIFRKKIALLNLTMFISRRFTVLKKNSFYFRQKALKALNDRMKAKDSSSEAWPDLDETQQSPLLPHTHHIESSSVSIDMNNLNEMTTSTKEDLNHPQTTS